MGVEIRIKKASEGLLPAPPFRFLVGNLALGADVSSEDGETMAIKSPSLTLTVVGMF